MINKKGLSDVVTTVLIVLLTIVAIAILWSFLQPMFTKSGAKIQQAESCLSVNMEVVQCAKAVGGATTVKRNPGAANLKEIKLVFEKDDGSTEVVTVGEAEVPQELGSAVYSDKVTFAPKSVAIAAGIADTQGVIAYCNPTQPVQCR